MSKPTDDPVIEAGAERCGTEGGRTAPVIQLPTDRPGVRVRDAIGEVLRHERRRQDRTLADVAERAAVSLPYLSEIERGRKEASSEVLEAVSRSLDLEVAEVLNRAADRLRPRSDGAGGARLQLLAA